MAISIRHSTTLVSFQNHFLRALWRFKLQRPGPQSHPAFINGLQMNTSYTYSKAMDDSTAEVNASDLTQRRPQSSRDQHAEYSRSALNRTNRLTVEAVYDLPYFKHSNFLLKNLVGNWQLSPIYTYESPEYVTPSSEDQFQLERRFRWNLSHVYNNGGNKQVGSGVIPVYSTTLAGNCTPPATTCNGNLVGYLAKNQNAYYITSGKGTLPDAERNTLAGRPIDNLTVAAGKRINFTERYSLSSRPRHSMSLTTLSLSPVLSTVSAALLPQALPPTTSTQQAVYSTSRRNNGPPMLAPCSLPQS